MSNFRDPQVWERVRETAKWQGIDTFEGHRCAVMSFEIRTHGMMVTNKTYFAEDLGYYPIHIESNSEEGIPMGDATGYGFQPCDTEGGTNAGPLRDAPCTESSFLVQERGSDRRECP